MKSILISAVFYDISFEKLLEILSQVLDKSKIKPKHIENLVKVLLI